MSVEQWPTRILLALWLGAFSLPHARAQQNPAQESTQLNRRVVELFGQGNFRAALPLALRSLEVRERELGRDHPEVAICLDNLGNLYNANGNYAEAEAVYRRALTLREKQLGPRHAATATSLNNLAAVYYATGAYAQAEPLFRRSLQISEELLGQEDPEVATTLSNLASLHEAAGEYAKAKPLYQRALGIREQALGPEHRATAMSVNSLANFYYATGNYPQAELLHQRALAIREKVLGAEHPETADSLNGLAALYRRTGAYAKAEPLYRRSLAIREKVSGPDHPDTATVLNNLAVLLDAMGAYARAEPLFQRALAIREKALGLEHPYTGTSVNNLALLYKKTGEYAKALVLHQRAVAINEKALGSEHPELATSLNNLASLQEAMGEYAPAEAGYRRAIAIYEKKFGSESADVARTLSNLAGLYDTIGKYVEAEALYQRALSIDEKVLGPSHPETATLLNNLAECYRKTGAYGAAVPLLVRALQIHEKVLGPDHPETANTLNSLAAAYSATGAYLQAEPLLRRSITILEKQLGAEHPDTALSVRNLAVLYAEPGAYAKAEPLHRRAVRILEKTLGEHPETALALNNLAATYTSMGVYERAEPLHQRALAIREKILGPEHPDTALSYSNLSALYVATGQRDKAIELLEITRQIREGDVVRFLISGAEDRKRAYLEKQFSEISVASSLALDRPSSRATRLALTGVLQYKGRALDAQASGISRLRRSAKREDQALIDELAAVAEEFSAAIYRGPGKLSVDRHRARLAALRARQEALQAQVSARSAALGHVLAPVTLAAVRGALPTDAVLIEWFRYRRFDPRAKAGQQFGAPRYVAYVLTRSGEPQAIDIGEAAPIESLIAKFRRALVDPTTASRGQVEKLTTPARVSVRELAAQLSDTLIKPLRPYFSERQRLLISPDGALNLLPFAALLDERGDYLARRFEISYLTSGRDLQRIAEEGSARSADVVLANPNYGRRRASTTPASAQAKRSAELDHGGLNWSPLPGTATEARRLQVLLGLDATRVITGDDATETRLRALHGPRILHLATHGFFLQDQEATSGLATVLGESPLLRSGLVLAGANVRSSAGDDGIFTAAEAAELDLAGTQLVVLSACETALGAVNAGEGVYGLRRALVLAGAQSQLSSLWKVDDAATQALMVEYYQRLLKGEGRAAALRSVQKTLLADPARQHPYYWAAFIPIGDWNPLRK